MVKERDELFNNKTVDTAGIILIRGPSKRSLAVMKLSLCFQSRGRPVHYLTLKGLTYKTDLKQKLARKRDEAVLIVEQIDQLLASGLPEVTEVVQLLEELLSQNKSFTLELCPQADSEGCLNGDLPALCDKQSTLSMKTMCLKEWKVGQLIQALSITEDLACVGEVREVRLVLLSLWKSHRREHCLRRLSALPLRELLQLLSHYKQVKKSAVIGALQKTFLRLPLSIMITYQRSTPTLCNDLGMLVQLEHIEVASAERMERVRTWLECNHGQEEMPSLDSEGNYVVNNPALVTG